QAVQPFEAETLNEPWRLPFPTCQEVERCPDPQHDRMHLALVRGHPPLLLRGAQPHEQDASTGAVKVLKRALLLVRGKRPERGTGAVDDLQTLEPSPQLGCELLQDVLGATVEANRDPLLGGQLAD